MVDDYAMDIMTLYVSMFVEVDVDSGICEYIYIGRPYMHLRTLTIKHLLWTRV